MSHISNLTRRIAAVILNLHATALIHKVAKADAAEIAAFDRVQAAKDDVTVAHRLLQTQYAKLTDARTQADLQAEATNAVHAEVTAELDSLPFVGR